MVVGMLNAGKSSLRRLGVRKEKAAATGAQTIITRTVKVSEYPTVYLVDTPDVMVSHIADPVRSLKVALTGGIRDDLSDEQVMVDCLHYRLNVFSNYDYAKWFGLPNNEPTNNVNELDLNIAAKLFLKHYRTRKLGLYTLDDVSPEAL